MVLKPLVLAFALAFCTEVRAQQPFAPLGFSPSAQQPSATPAPPPLPFRYIGSLRQNGKLEVLLMRGSAVYSLAAGDEIDGEYRVERITESTISFTYLPLKTKQDMHLQGS
ncbi:MAG TPA: hypothetical protein VFZ84_12935 [Burkholderiales bacterium]